MDNRKNTILLTVIAVATLLVAVVGATFAYFTAQGGGKRQTNVQVTTSTSSSSTIQVNGSMTVHADQTTFGKDAAAHVTTPEATANISWTPSNAAAGSDLNFCYSVELQVTGNDFEYADADNLEDTGSELTQYYDTPELLLSITKGGTSLTGSGGTGSVTGLTYETVAAALTGTRPEVSGWDLTGATVTTYDITDGTDNIHQISGSAGQTSNENWTAQVTLVNKTVDQNYNTDKTFTANLIFTEVDCTSGDPIVRD